MVVEIPYDAEHKLVADRSDLLRYIYINDYSRPVLNTPGKAAAEYKTVEAECEEDIRRGQSMWLKPPAAHAENLSWGLIPP